jgi:hypothetical protein
MKESFYISFGVWLAIVPFLGIPGTWRNTLVTLSGVFLILVSLGPIILKRLQTKPKPRTRKKAELKFSDTVSTNISQSEPGTTSEVQHPDLPPESHQ